MQANSEIITSPVEQSLRIGTPLGGHGLAMLGLSSAPQHPDPDLAADILRSSLVFIGHRADTEAEAQSVREMVEYLEKPATRKWIAGRALTLLSQYFAPNMDESVAKAIAEDWCEMLSGYPAWAIANACRWWMGRENPNKARRPLPGDIQDAAHREMEKVRVARIALSRGVALPQPEPQQEARACTPEELERRRQYAAQVMGSIKGMSA